MTTQQTLTARVANHGQGLRQWNISLCVFSYHSAFSLVDVSGRVELVSLFFFFNSEESISPVSVWLGATNLNLPSKRTSQLFNWAGEPASGAEMTCIVEFGGIPTIPYIEKEKKNPKRE